MVDIEAKDILTTYKDVSPDEIISAQNKALYNQALTLRRSNRTMKLNDIAVALKTTPTAINNARKQLGAQSIFRTGLSKKTRLSKEDKIKNQELKPYASVLNSKKSSVEEKRDALNKSEEIRTKWREIKNEKGHVIVSSKTTKKKNKDIQSAGIFNEQFEEREENDSQGAFSINQNISQNDIKVTDEELNKTIAVARYTK